MRKRPIFKEIIVHESMDGLILPTPSRLVNVGSKKHRKDYLKLYCGYDCETTTLHVAGQGWRSAVYIHQFSIANDSECHVILLRTWEEMQAFLQYLIDYYQLSEDRRLIMWDANLSFEFSFLQHRLQWCDFFAKEERQPLLASHLNCIDFREALTISGGSLAYLAKTYCYTQKLKGDLDYSINRNTHTYLSHDEMQYCINDVVILAEFSHHVFKAHIIPDRKIPMTKTGIIVSQLKRDFLKLSKKMDKYGAHKQAYLNHIQKCYPDHETYEVWFTFLFRGGYVHANALYAANDLPSVDMYDIKSSYPSVMLTDYVPITKFKRVQFNREYLNTKCCILYCTFYSIKISTYHTIESKNKIVYAENAAYDNGRLISADVLQVILTEIDYKIYSSFYKWERVSISACFIADRGKLPRFLRDLLVKNYIEKEQLSAQGLKDSTDYKIKKEVVNTMYGVCVKRIRLDKITYEDGEWTRIKNEKSYNDEIKDTLLLPQWGIWITAHARYNLLSVVKKLNNNGVSVVYCDTDSIKYISNPRAEKIIKAYNIKRWKHLRNRGYKQKALSSLGAYDKENKAPVRFKALGAKRYLYEDETGCHATVAGMPKQAIKNLGTNSDTIFSTFTDYGFTLATENSMKKTTAYTDEAYSLYVDGEWMNEESGVALYDIPFSMKLSDTYAQYITLMQSAERVGFCL